MAEVQFPLARALPAKDAARAKQLATAAAAAFATGGVTYTDRATAAEAWLRSRR